MTTVVAEWPLGGELVLGLRLSGCIGVAYDACSGVLCALSSRNPGLPARSNVSNRKAQ